MITEMRNIPSDLKENGIDKDYDQAFVLLCRNIKIEIPERRFVYFIDSNYVMDTTKGDRYENLTPAYWKILDSGLCELKYPMEDETDRFCASYNSVIDQLELLVDRIIEALKQSSFHTEKQIKWFENLKSVSADGFEEAIQRMLFVNQIFWQTDHRLTGLGAWDFYLASYYEEDLRSGKIDKGEALEIIKDLYRTLHEYYSFKNNYPDSKNAKEAETIYKIASKYIGN